jgi:hypothetical protein
MRLTTSWLAEQIMHRFQGKVQLLKSLHFLGCVPKAKAVLCAAQWTLNRYPTWLRNFMPSPLCLPINVESPSVQISAILEIGMFNAFSTVHSIWCIPSADLLARQTAHKYSERGIQMSPSQYYCQHRMVKKHQVHSSWDNSLKKGHQMKEALWTRRDHLRNIKQWSSLLMPLELSSRTA